MKKYFFVVAAAVSLAACGNHDGSQTLGKLVSPLADKFVSPPVHVKLKNGSGDQALADESATAAAEFFNAAFRGDTSVVVKFFTREDGVSEDSFLKAADRLVDTFHKRMVYQGVESFVPVTAVTRNFGAGYNSLVYLKMDIVCKNGKHVDGTGQTEVYKMKDGSIRFRPTELYVWPNPHPVSICS